jgi:very-short-patch-repair endonuclease
VLQGTPDSRRQAKALRKTLSLPEVLLWQALKARPGGFKFRKQHSAGPYVADFYCHEARPIIEVDGDNHDFGDRPERDRLRDAWFAGHGLVVLHIPAREVLSDCDAAVTGIVDRAAQRRAQQE